MNVRPFVLLSDATVSAVESMARDIVTDWLGAWGQTGAVEVTAVGAASAAGSVADGVVWRSGAAGGACAFAWSGQFPHALHKLLFGSDRMTAASLAAAAARSMLDQLVERLDAALGAPGERMPLPHAPGSGALLLKVGCGAEVLFCLVSPAALHARFPRRQQALPAALAPVRFGALFGTLPVLLPIRAGAAQLTLGSLASLAVGDVIRLDRPVDQPLSVHGAGGEHLCNGYLGLQGGEVSIEVVSKN